ncbi:MAG TPA: hypothetical protein VFV17_04000 [Usitatibacteraceae bacterium]|nr:hypothetical protein [Usitatibacteraceae bacterium]
MKSLLRRISYCLAAFGILGASALLLPGIASADDRASPCAGCAQGSAADQSVRR